MTDLTTWREDSEYVIFDDFDFEFMPSKKGWFGAQKEFTTSDKYLKKKTIRNWGKPMIYLCNEDDDPRLKKGWSRWFNDVTKIVEIPFLFVQFK